MKRIVVFCGSRAGRRAIFSHTAVCLAEYLAARKVGIVYGGARIGLMGILADAALKIGGEVIGVIPQALADREVAHTGLSTLHVVNSMHQRKALMAELGDGFIALPGGFGTLDEFCEALTWAQLGLHRKPLGLLNVEGYYDALLRMFQLAVREDFLRPETRALVLDSDSHRALLQKMGLP
ncbi:MAG: TIGR00730 family Rossman fold protein [Candidatus Eremiobacteraeota bacterium]|nr:TIGR00730 family Rossman fold protein [Candidatus Eremiobacteraeota bacterium]